MQAKERGCGMSQIEVVRFHGDELQVVRDGEQPWVVMKRVCEALGIAEQRQAEKLKGKPWATTTLMVAVAEDGKNRELFCLHLDSLPMWLATIEAKRAKPDARPKLIEYQRECARVLRDHFFGRPRKNNGARRHLPPSQIAAIGVLIFERSQVWRREREERRMAANAARAERSKGNQNAAKSRSEGPENSGTSPEVPLFSGSRSDSTNSEAKLIATHAGVGRSTVQRMQKLAKEDPTKLLSIARGEKRERQPPPPRVDREQRRADVRRLSRRPSTRPCAGTAVPRGGRAR